MPPLLDSFVGQAPYVHTVAVSTYASFFVPQQ